MAIHTMDFLKAGHTLPFSFPLPNTDREVRGLAKVVWTDCSGRAGLEFIEMSEAGRLWVRQWLTGHQDCRIA